MERPMYGVYRTWVWLVLFCDAVQEEEQSVGDVYL